MVHSNWLHLGASLAYIKPHPRTALAQTSTWRSETAGLWSAHNTKTLNKCPNLSKLLWSDLLGVLTVRNRIVKVFNCPWVVAHTLHNGRRKSKCKNLSDCQWRLSAISFVTAADFGSFKLKVPPAGGARYFQPYEQGTIGGSSISAISPKEIWRNSESSVGEMWTEINMEEQLKLCPSCWVQTTMWNLGPETDMTVCLITLRTDKGGQSWFFFHS